MFSYNKVTSGKSQIQLRRRVFIRMIVRDESSEKFRKNEVRVLTKFRADLEWVRRDRDNPKFLGLALS